MHAVDPVGYSRSDFKCNLKKENRTPRGVIGEATGKPDASFFGRFAPPVAAVMRLLHNRAAWLLASTLVLLAGGAAAQNPASPAPAEKPGPGKTTLPAARAWYVAPPPLGSDDNPGTASRPFATITKGAASAFAGETVWIQPGAYRPADPIRPARSGTPEAPITYRAQPGGEVIVDGQGKIPGSDWYGVFTVDRRNWIVIDGLRVINSRWFGICANDATGITVQNCSTKDTLASGIHIERSSQVKLLRNSVQRACQAPASTPPKATQECLSLNACTEFEVAYNAVFDRMEDTNNGGEGIDTKGACRNGKVHHNHVHDLVRVGMYTDSYGSLLENIEVFANTVHHCPSGIVVACEEGGTARGVRIHDNLVRACPKLGLRVAGYLKNGPIQDLSIYQNTIVRCGARDGTWDDSGLLVDASNPDNRNFVVRNNIFAENVNQIRTGGQAYLTIQRNLLDGPSLVAGVEAVLADPRFADARGNDFRLLPGSPACGAAAGDPISGRDHDGRARPAAHNGSQQGAGALGAFECGPPSPEAGLPAGKSRVDLKAN